MKPMWGARCRGFTYPMVLVMVTTTAIMAGITEHYTSQFNQREKEAELLFRGEQYVRAIESYYLSGRQLPQNLEDLLKDPRYLSRQHIRRLYADPFADSEDGKWTLLRDSTGGITGVASKSQKTSIKKGNFPIRFAQFTGLEKYSEWKFEFDPNRLKPMAAVPPPLSLGGK